MSDNENQLPLPSQLTSSVPLKKETVRVTLKAADAPPAVPSATVPMAAPVRPPVPGGAAPAPAAPPAPPTPTALGSAPRPPAPAPTIPLRTTGAPAAPSAPAPTIKLATSTAPIGPPGAATKPPGAATKPPSALAPSPTIPLKPAGSPSLPAAGGAPTLPKATVQLQAPTQPLGTSFPSASQAATLRVEEDDDEGAANDGVVKILAGVGFAAALALLAFQLMLSNTWISVEDNPRAGDWSQLLE